VRTVRLFVSSPSDVEHERQRVERVAERLNGEFTGLARIEAIHWDTSFYGAQFYSAHAEFRSQIPAAAVKNASAELSRPESRGTPALGRPI
jgi:hypothetical protein